MAIDDGGPAFPQSIAEIHGRATNSGEFGWPGLSIRDYFAAQALAGICACGDDQVETDTDQVDFVAQRAYHYADAMLAARVKPPQEA